MKSVLLVYVFDVASKAVLAFAGLLLIRYLPCEEYARYTLALSLITVATQTLAASFNRIYIVGHDQLFAGRSPSLILGLQLWLIVAAAVLFLPWRHGFAHVYWWIAIVTVANCFSEFAKTFCQIRLHFGRYSAIELCRSLLMVLSVSGLIYLFRGQVKAWQVLLGQAAAMLAVFVVAFSGQLQLREMLRLKTASRLALEIVRGEYRYLFGYFFLLAFFLQVDVFMLNALSSRVEVATYGSAFRYFLILSLALNAVHTVLFPMLQKVNSKLEIQRIFNKHRIMVILFAPTVLVSIWLARWVLPWIDLGKYPRAVPTFQILAASAIVSFAFSPYINVLMRFKDFKFLLGLLTSTLVLNVALSIVLLPRFGAIGAAIATVCAVGVLNASSFLRARDCMPSWLALAGEAGPCA